MCRYVSVSHHLDMAISVPRVCAAGVRVCARVCMRVCTRV